MMKATHKYTTGEPVAVINIQMTVTLDLITYCILQMSELGSLNKITAKDVEAGVRSQLRSDGDIHWMYKMNGEFNALEIKSAKRVAIRLFPTFKKS